VALIATILRPQASDPRRAIDRAVVERARLFAPERFGARARYTNRLVLQHCPALVVAVHTVRSTELLWVLMVASAANRSWPGDVVVSNLHTAGAAGGLRGVIRQIATIEARGRNSDHQSVGQHSRDKSQPSTTIL
jgi:hypothetical protein